MKKKDVCEITPEELLSRISITPIANSRRCFVEFNGEKFISKECSVNEIVKKIQSRCKCACGDKIPL